MEMMANEIVRYIFTYVIFNFWRYFQWSKRILSKSL